ncbi:MAG: hypothetical protein CHKLHMKO_00382 [Candidatus Argoarchaeum ethanivorans]|uniref:Clan AA aspartic protease n=1 Tax=Candidatus Argoarchaeum ethanivorans TaxID=2608793 RepID=A0A811T6H7_9EURY|nr:MAG: hypothetical protein CHKLHMKO_00382 [Candidatus Argoarchaeum ethanivorans]
MIKGEIGTVGSPIIKAKIIGSRAEIVTDGILDTGFSGHLCLPITTAVSLGLELTGLERVELADGTILEDEPVFSGRMEWNEGIVDVDIVLTKSADALLGTALLGGMEVRLNYSTNEVVLEKKSK